MKKSPLLTTVAVTLIVVSVLTAGCHSQKSETISDETGNRSTTVSHSDILRLVAYPGVISDGAGGAIAAYSELTSDIDQEIHVQRVSESGEKLWDRLLGAGLAAANQHLPIVSDGSGGCITYASIWEEMSGHSETILRISSGGEILWQMNLPVNRRVDAITPDGEGGAFISYRDSRQQNNCFIQKIDNQGNFAWGEEELILRRDTYQYDSIRMIEDGNDGILITWHERDKSGTRVCGQRVDMNGAFIWEGQSLIKQGKVLYTTEKATAGQWGQMTEDSSGNIVLTWIETEPATGLANVAAMKVSATGDVVWTNQIAQGEEAALRAYLSFPVVTCNNDETLLVWSNVDSVFAQKLDSAGKQVWDEGGITVWNDENTMRLSSRGAGENTTVFLVSKYMQKEDEPQETRFRVQKIIFREAPLYTFTSGPAIRTTVNTFSTPTDLALTGDGGVIVAWVTGKEVSDSEDSFIQSVDGAGIPVWKSGGIKLGE